LQKSDFLLRVPTNFLSRLRVQPEFLDEDLFLDVLDPTYPIVSRFCTVNTETSGVGWCRQSD